MVKANFIGFAGLGLKEVAVHGAGFGWRDEDPGGLQSQSWLAVAQTVTFSPIRGGS